MDGLIEIYKEKLRAFEAIKDDMEILTEENPDARSIANMYYMLLIEIIKDLKLNNK